MTPLHVLIAGCGYVGLALGARLALAGHQVTGLRRPGSDGEPLAKAGIQPAFANLTHPAGLHQLQAPDPGWDAVVLCAAPAESTEPAYRALYVEGTRHLLDYLDRHPPRLLLFTGSTSVYGQSDGSDVDESATTAPVDFAGRILLEAEQLILGTNPRPFHPVILRCAGIYGPGRHRLATFRRGQASLRGDGSRWMNLIHREDLVDAMLLLLLQPPTGTTLYNVADGASPTETEFHSWLTQRLGLPRTSAVPSDTSRPGRRTRVPTHRRILSDRLRRELGWHPAHPDFKAGYEALIRSGE